MEDPTIDTARRSLLRRVLRVALCTFAGVILLIAGIITWYFATLYTPGPLQGVDVLEHLELGGELDAWPSGVLPLLVERDIPLSPTLTAEATRNVVLVFRDGRLVVDHRQ